MKGLEFYQGKRVLITGNTGFKGAWLSKFLLMAGAELTGYALSPQSPSLFSLCSLEREFRSVYADIRDAERLQQVMRETQPEVVFHLAAQPLVRESYRNPVETYETNVMGTVYLLEGIRHTDSVHSVINVTTDKVYLNREWERGYSEDDELNGYDPYSNSKSCSELVTGTYCRSFFKERELAVSTLRAGNVIGGGDFAVDRLVPDCVAAALTGREIVLRNSGAVRPFQHVLEPLSVYLRLAMLQAEQQEYAGSYNVGPDYSDCVTTKNLVEIFCATWNKETGENLQVHCQSDGGPHEANLLRLDCTKLKERLQWNPRWSLQVAIEKVVEWTLAYRNGGDLNRCMEKQIEEFYTGKSY